MPNLTEYVGVSRLLNADATSDQDLQRSKGFGRVVVSGSEEGNRIMDIYQQSPIRIMFPISATGAVDEAVIVNTAGGIAGGDRLEVSVTAKNNASIAVTSQAAEKVYRALSKPALVTTRLAAYQAARLAWLPQETIVFNSARLSRETEIEVSSDAELLALEWLVLGRVAHGEEVVTGYISDGWRVKKDGRLLWADKFRVTEEVFPQLGRKALLSNARAIATLIYFGPAAESQLEFVRNMLPSFLCNCSVTSLHGLVIFRLAANVSTDLRLTLCSLLRQFERLHGSTTFRAPKMWSC
jgi:urease accessory protein